MSTLAQVQRLAAPFVDQHDDLVLVGREVVVRPMHHLFRSVYIDRTSSKGEIAPWWRAYLLFSPGGPTGWSNRLPIHGAVDGPRIAESFALVMRNCLDETLRPLTDIEAAMSLPRQTAARQELSALEESLIVTARGDFANAARGLGEAIAEEEQRLQSDLETTAVHYRRGGKGWLQQIERHDRLRERLASYRQLESLLKQGAKEPLAEQLRQWERVNVTALKVDHLWLEMPFPFEVKRHHAAKMPAVSRLMSPLLARRKDIALEGRRLMLTPIRHFVRGIEFGESPTGTQLRPRWFVDVAFSPPSDFVEDIGQRLMSAEPTLDNFERLVAWHCDTVIEERLQYIGDIGEFLRQTDAGHYDAANGSRWLAPHFDSDRGAILASLGRLPEAQAALTGMIGRAEVAHADLVKRSRHYRLKQPDGQLTQQAMRAADSTLRLAQHHRQLLALVDAADRVGIAMLLREWEAVNIRKWGLEHLWEPTPFPIEVS